MKASTILIRSKIPMTTGVLACKDGKMCADGVLAHAMGYSIEDMSNAWYIPLVEQRLCYYEEAEEKFYRKVQERFGIDKKTWHEIASKNDNGWTFKQIGYWLKEKGL